MIEWIQGYAESWTLMEGQPELSQLLSQGLLLLFILGIGLIADLFIRHILLRIIGKVVIKTRTKIDEMLYQRKFFHRLAHVAPATIFYIFAPLLGDLSVIVQKMALAYMILMVTLAMFKIIDVGNALYNRTAYASERPIKSLMQVFKLIIAVFCGLFLLVLITNDSTVKALLGGLGGFSAITLLIFRDSILGLVAGIQLTANQQLAIGDWIEMPQFKADGEVTDITLTKIVVRNWDRTYTNIPAHRFLEDAFINWKGMSQSGGRRIMRSLHVHVGSVHFLSEEEIKKMSEIRLLKDYLKDKQAEIKAFNEGLGIDVDDYTNGRHLTNIGIFRVYVERYLKAHKGIQEEGFILMVRQLQPLEKGIPIEVYCFTNTTNWVVYEQIQSDIFDHLLAMAPVFGISIYQAPSGDDLRALTIKNTV